MGDLLVLRPEPDGRATVERARELGLHAWPVPLFQIESVEWSGPDPGGFDGLLLTSRNAVRYGGEQLQRYRGLKTYAVGGSTAEAARAAGFDVAARGDAGVDRLLGSIAADLKLLHLCGEHRRDPCSVRQQITALIVYRAKAIEDPDLSRVRGSIALIHSPRAASRLAELVDDKSSTSVAAISSAAADAAGGGWKDVRIAEQPSDCALLAVAAGLCNNASPG